jgi:surface protein
MWGVVVAAALGACENSVCVNGSDFYNYINETCYPDNATSACCQTIQNLDVSRVLDFVEFHAITSFDFECYPLNLTGWGAKPFAAGTSFRAMFAGSNGMPIGLETWQTQNVVDMSLMFQGNANFNKDIGGWDVSSVTTMYYMFDNADAFNQDIGGWDVSSVTNMEGMFTGADAFNQSLACWDVGSNVDVTGMFYNAANFESNLVAWPVGVGTAMFENSAMASRPECWPGAANGLACALPASPCPTRGGGGGDDDYGWAVAVVVVVAAVVVAVVA